MSGSFTSGGVSRWCKFMTAGVRSFFVTLARTKSNPRRFFVAFCYNPCFLRPVSTNEPDNIECFSLAARAILTRLLESFPRPVEIGSVAFQEDLVYGGELPASCAWKEGSACLVESTLEYLAAEGVIRVAERAAPLGTDPDGALCPVFIWRGVALTSKGFTALNRPMPEHPTGKTLAAALRAGGRRVTTHAAKVTVTEAIRTFFQAL